MPFWWSAQECPPPAVMAVASVMPTTPTGIEESSSLLLPRWPPQLLPQQDMVPSWWSAQECPPPAVMAVASVMPVTLAGTDDLAFSPLCPLPSCPQSLLPQQDIVPSWWSAQEWPVAAATAVAPFAESVVGGGGAVVGGSVAGAAVVGGGVVVVVVVVVVVGAEVVVVVVVVVEVVEVVVVGAASAVTVSVVVVAGAGSASCWAEVVLGGGRDGAVVEVLVCGAEVSSGDVLSESLPQLAASRAKGISKQRAMQVRGRVS